MRWRESTSSLLVLADPKPSTFVVIGPLQVAYTNREARDLMQWVESGGRLVIVDRNPDPRLLAPDSEWMIVRSTRWVIRGVISIRITSNR